MLSYIPLPNIPNAAAGSPNYEVFAPTPAKTDGADLRMDQTITSKQSIYARFSRKNILQDAINPFLPNDEDSIHNRSLIASYQYTITPKLLNEFRFGLTFVTTAVGFPIQGAAALKQLGLQNVDISQHPLTNAFPLSTSTTAPASRPSVAIRPVSRSPRTLQFADNLTYTFGKHTLRGESTCGAYATSTSKASPPSTIRRFRRLQLPAHFDQCQRHPWPKRLRSFSPGSATTSYFAVSSPDVGGTAYETSFFAQDEWQVNSKLTISYGLRYTLLPPFIEDGGNLANFDQRTNSVVVPDNLAGYCSSRAFSPPTWLFSSRSTRAISACVR